MTSRELGWSNISAELRSHPQGTIASRSAGDTELMLLLRGRSRIRGGGGLLHQPPLPGPLPRSLLVEMQAPTRYGALLADGLASTLAARLIHKYAGPNCDSSSALSCGRGL